MLRKGQVRSSPARAGSILLALIFAIGTLGALPTPSAAQDGSPGITTPRVLAPFDADARSCSPPAGLERRLVFAPENRRQFLEGVGYGLARAAQDRGLAYQVLTADNDAEKQKAQVEGLVASRAGALVTAPVDPMSLSHSLQRFMWRGGYVGAVVPPPATTILNAPQYLTGKTLGDAAAAYIRDHFGGRADVVLLTQDSLEFLAPRFAAIRDSLKTMPGVTIVADLSPSPVSKEGGFATMSTVLEAHQSVDAVLGADTVVLGALAALRANGKARPDQYLGGIDGEPEAVAEIKKGDGPYKASVALSSPVFGYALGAYAADWLDGKSVPQAMDILPVALTIGNLAGYEADQIDPAAVFADPARRASYLKAYGNICYDTRDQYLNFPWSSETKP
jgi:ribose transport system substrate-binding protein